MPLDGLQKIWIDKILNALSEIKVLGTTVRIEMSDCPDFLIPIIQKINEISENSEPKSHSQMSLDPATFEAIIENMPVSIFLKDANDNFKVTLWNHAAETAFEVSKKEILGKTAHDLWPKEEADFYRLIDQKVIKDRNLVDIPEEASHSKSRGTRYFHTKKLPLQFPGRSEMQYLLCISEDITEKRNSEIKLKKALSDLEEVQKTAKIGSWTFNLNTSTLLWSSETFKIFEIPELNSNDQLNSLYRSRLHPKDLEKWNLMVDEAKLSGKGFIFHHRLVFQDGRIKHVQSVGNVKRDESGNFLILGGTCQDISERIQKQEENQFILDSLQLGVWKFNPADQSLLWDESMYRLYELDPKNFSGHYEAWESCLSPETKEKAVEALQKALRGEKEFDTTFEIITPNHQKKYIGGRGRVIRNSKGQATMMYGINFDRTQEVKLEIQIESERLRSVQNSKLASLGELSAGVAHEINNPLSIIAGNASLLENFRNDPVKYQQKIETIHKSIERISKIIGGLKKFARGGDVSARAPIPLSKIIKESLLMTEGRAKRHSTELQLNIESHAQIMCNNIEIEQVLINLVNNAIDAVKGLEEKWIKIHLFEESDELILQVQDSGPGIPSEIQKKLFQPFFTTKPIGEGTGLGLSISKGILDQHSAGFTVKSDLAHTCFEIRFKIDRSEGRAA